MLELGLSTASLQTTCLTVVMLIARNNTSAMAKHFQKMKTDKRFTNEAASIRVMIIVYIAQSDEVSVQDNTIKQLKLFHISNEI